MPAGTKLIAGNKPVSFLTAQQLQQLQQQGQATQVTAPRIIFFLFYDLASPEDFILDTWGSIKRTQVHSLAVVSVLSMCSPSSPLPSPPSKVFKCFWSTDSAMNIKPKILSGGVPTCLKDCVYTLGSFCCALYCSFSGSTFLKEIASLLCISIFLSGNLVFCNCK